MMSAGSIANLLKEYAGGGRKSPATIVWTGRGAEMDSDWLRFLIDGNILPNEAVDTNQLRNDAYRFLCGRAVIFRAGWR